MFVLYWPFVGRELQNEQTSHFDCRVFEYRAAGVGIYGWAADGEVRLVVHVAVAVRGSVAQPGMSVAAKGEVRSILVVSKKPIHLAKRIALDASSRSSQALVRILAAEHWNIQPEFVETAPDASEMLKNADAALVIGDPALRIALKMEALSVKVSSGGDCCKGDPEDMPVPGFETIFVYDVAYQWREMTGKPCVLAIWAGHRDAITSDVVADFQASKAYGLERLREISEAAAIKLDMPPRALERYLADNIHYGLEPDYLGGLNLYYEKAAAAGLIPRHRPLEFAATRAASASSSTAHHGAGW